jgi:hypothetical protein
MPMRAKIQLRPGSWVGSPGTPHSHSMVEGGLLEMS